MKKTNNATRKLEAVTPKTLVIGIDIAKHTQWARFIDCRGMECSKAFKFGNDRNGFNAILAEIRKICNESGLDNTIVGMEPTGHYWKALANFLMKQEKTTVVLVNPYHTKKAKELDDNSPTKSDRKDALTVARLVKDGRYSDTYLPHDVYAELRGLSTSRLGMNKRKGSIENAITAVMDEYFPEFATVFKHPFKGKASVHVMKSCPIPKDILELGEEGVLAEIKKAVKKSVGRKKAGQLVVAAKDSAGVDYGEHTAAFKIRQLMEERELLEKQLLAVEKEMEAALSKTGLAEYLLSIKGIGVVTLAMCLGELGDPLRFEDAGQMGRMAGYNLIEDSSGKNKSRTRISKRGRKNLRCVLYMMAVTMVATNKEMGKLYNYLKTRENNPLKKQQALVVISKKILMLIFTLARKKECYNPKLVFGAVRREQLKAA
jgi:transposase